VDGQRLYEKFKVQGSKFKVIKMVMDETAAFEDCQERIPPEIWALSENPPKNSLPGLPTGLTKFSLAHLIS
jgi:hypothetical protein